MKSVSQQLRSVGKPTRGHAASAAYSPPRVLLWKLDAASLASIELASSNFRTLVRKFELRVLSFPHFGRLFCKRVKITPDFFIQVEKKKKECGGTAYFHEQRLPLQMAIQLAHWRLHKEFVATYETAHTRLFYHGRTETSEPPLHTPHFVAFQCVCTSASSRSHL